MSAAKKLRIFLRASLGEDYNPDTSQYDLIMALHVGISPWEQVSEMLIEAGLDPKRYPKEETEITVAGSLGMSTISHLKELSMQGGVTWYVDAASVEPARSQLGSLMKIEPLLALGMKKGGADLQAAHK